MFIFQKVYFIFSSFLKAKIKEKALKKVENISLSF